MKTAGKNVIDFVVTGAVVVLMFMGCGQPDNAQDLIEEKPYAIERVSVDGEGNQGDGTSSRSSVNSDGRYVAFSSYSTNFVPADKNGTSDIFVYDRQAASIEMVSVDSEGLEGNLGSYRPCINTDGRYVAFVSEASNLLPNDTNGVSDVFVFDRQTRNIERVSISSSGGEGNKSSQNPSISADGRFVAFSSMATNLVEYDINNCLDIFVYDRNLDTIRRVPIYTMDGSEWYGDSINPSISSDGCYVAFQTNVKINHLDNDGPDILVYDIVNKNNEIVSCNNTGTYGDGGSGEPSISGDGRFVAFSSVAKNLVFGDMNNMSDIFVYDRQNDAIECVSIDKNGIQGNGNSFSPSISGDGRFVSFRSSATNLVSGDTNNVDDIFVYDRLNDSIRRMNVDGRGTQGDGPCNGTPTISADGNYMTFQSEAKNLVPGDTNGVADIFIAPSH